MNMERNMVWDGEKIKEVISEEEKKHSPKDILNGLDNVRTQLNQMKNSGTQLEQQTKTNNDNIADAEKFEKQLAGFEEKCVELQKEKIKFIVEQIKDDCIAKAEKSAAETIAKTPDAYTEETKKKLPFLDYQKLLATNEKMAEKISNRMIRTYLYEEPVFDNPFEG